MPITVDLGTDIGKLRFVIGDDNETAGGGARPDGTNFTDAQLQVALDEFDNWQDAVPTVLRVLANLYAREARLTKIADYSEDCRQIAKELREQADAWAENPPSQVTDADMVSGITDANSTTETSPIPFGWRLFEPRIMDQRS
jgi:hypothetical protein